MTLATWTTLVTAVVVISMTPGAGAVNTMTNSIAQGWRRSFWGVLGQQFALIIQLTIVAVGVGAIVSAVPGVLTAVRWIGAAYLVYLGVRMLLARPVVPSPPEHQALDTSTTADGRVPGSGTAGVSPGATSEKDATRARPGHQGAWSMIRRGMLVNLLNPKPIVFFLAFIPPFIRADQPQLPQYLIIGVTCVVVDVIIMWFGFAMLAKPLGRLMHTVRGQRILNTIFGLCFIAVAGLLLLLH